jgi:hypothetical protein
MDKDEKQKLEKQLRNLKDAIRFLAEALQGLAEEDRLVEFLWAKDAIKKVDEKLNHD